MAANLQGLMLTDLASQVYSFEPYKEDNQSRGIKIESRDWELGDPISYWRVPLFPFDGGLRQDRLPTTVSITDEFNKSRSYAKANMDASNEGVLVPPPLVNSIALTNEVTATKELTFESKQFFLCGRYIYTIARDGTLALEKDFGSGSAGVDMEVFNNALVVAMGESEFIYAKEGGVWYQSSDVYAIAFGAVGNKLWRAHDVNQIDSCTTGAITLSQYTPANPNEYTAGDTTYSIHGIIEYGGVVVVLRPDGVFMPDALSNFHNQAPQMAKWPHSDNGKGAFTAQGYLWVPSIVGLIRITLGESLVLGPEKSNRPDFRFWVRGGVEWGDSIYLLVTDEIEVSESFICKMTRDERGVTENHSYIYHEWTRLGNSNKGYAIGINTWPSSGPISVTRDAGTIANVAVSSNTDWSNPSNAAANDGSYATTVYTGAEGTSDQLRFSNFGFTPPSDSTILGYIVGIERKTSASSGNTGANTNDVVANAAGAGVYAWTMVGNSPVFNGAADVTRITQYAKFTDYDYAVPSNATIVGVVLSFYRAVTTGGNPGQVTDYQVKLVVGGSVVGTNKAVVTPWPTSGAARTYGSATDTWGLTLTPAQVNTTTFGFVVSASVNGLVQAVVIGNSCTLTVYYTVDGTEDVTVQLVNASAAAEGDNKASTTDWANTDILVSYGDAADQWGTAFTATDVADSDFGFILVVENPSGITASVDYGSITLVYQEAEVVTNPVMFVGNGSTIKYITLGFGSGRDIEDPTYPFGLSGEVETGLIQPSQNITLVSGLIGNSIVSKIRDVDSITLAYALGEDTTYTNLLTTAEGGGTAAITGDNDYENAIRYAQPNITGPYFKFKLSATFGAGSGTDRFELRSWWAFGYTRPKVTDLITIPIYFDRMALNGNGIPQGDTGGDTLRIFRKWKRDQEVLAMRFADYEMGRTIRVRVVSVSGNEIISEKQTEGHSREVFVGVITFIRDDFAGAFADG